MATPLNVTEWMKGYIGFGAADYDAGFHQGIDANTHFMHEVVIRMDDIDRFVSEPTHEARMDGYIECAALGGRRQLEPGATFNMLLDANNPKLKVMLYRMPFIDESGARRTVFGHKTIHDDHSFDLWGDITTLYIRVFDGDVPGPDVLTPSMAGSTPPGGPPAAMGVIHIEKLDGFKSARSFQSPGSSPAEAARAVALFGGFYLDKLWEIFGPSMRVVT